MLTLVIALLPLIAVLAFALIGTRNCPSSCPECDSEISRFQSPFTKTERQWMKGGYRCANCDCQMDLGGKVITSEATASPQFAATLLLCTAAAIILILVYLPTSF